MQRVMSVTDLAELQALAHPLRLQILQSLREPGSAASVARAIGQPRQKVNYHLKELERVGLVRSLGERRSGNFLESIYQAIARTFVVSPRVAWADGRRVQAMADQLSLERLVTLGERLQSEAAALLDRAAFDGEEISSAAVEAEVGFATEEQRAAFLTAYLAAVGPLLREYGSTRGARYRVVAAVYPRREGGS